MTAGLAEALRWRPWWPVAVLAAVAWLVVLGAALAPAAAAPHSGHAAGPGAPATLLAGHDVVMSLGAWTVMSVAMMLPLTLPAVGYVSVNSFPWRRGRAMTLYVAGFVALWVAVGVLVIAATSWLRAGLGIEERVLLPGTLLVAAAWQLTPTKRRALLRCHRTVPLPPLGLRADAACARFALEHAWRCAVSCWPLMAVMVVAGHAAIGWMIGISLLLAVEELTLVGRRLLRPSAVALAAVAFTVALVPAVIAG